MFPCKMSPRKYPQLMVPKQQRGVWCNPSTYTSVVFIKILIDLLFRLNNDQMALGNCCSESCFSSNNSE
uniref:Ovule protein n=1 Tax=Romanomermis culicivorax TaxID=13658 RepID=A0A915KYU8_ROMCU